MNQEIRLIEQEFVTLDYRTIKPLQGERKVLLPDAEKRLLTSLSTKGRFVPEYVWRNPQDGEYYTLDGHSRLKTYQKHNLTFNGGYELPFLLVKADNPKDAAEKLQIIDSDYGKVTQAGQQAFADMFQLDVKWLNETTMLTEFPTFDFIDAFRSMKAHLDRDMIVPQVRPAMPQESENAPQSSANSDIPRQPDNSVYPQQPSYEDEYPRVIPQVVPQVPPKVTDDNYSNISEVVKYEYKLEYNEVMQKIIAQEGIDRREEAFIFMVRKFKEYYQ